MPNGYDYNKEYYSHFYDNEEGHNCKYCSCWMSNARSGGPLGVDPFGECPGNPKDGKRLGGNADHEVVVTRRIRGLEQALQEATTELAQLRKIKNTPKARMAERIKALEAALKEREKVFKEIKGQVDKIITFAFPCGEIKSPFGG